MDFDTFSKSDFRVVKVKECSAVKKSKKLLHFVLDDGTGIDRIILSGIHAYYEPEELVGKTLLAITNLPNADVVLLMEKDKNIVQVAKNELFKRYNENKETIRTNGINKQIDSKTAINNAVSGVNEEIKKSQEQRKKYLQTLGGK